MSDHPIIFSAPMVQAILNGQKCQTRRLAWREPTPYVIGTKRAPKREVHLATPWQKVKPGDRLWVRENWRSDSPDDPERALYKADTHGELPRGFKWKPSIHMPRWASRLTLIVTAAKIERLQNISAEDSQAEGIWREDLPVAPIFHCGASDREGKITALSAKTCFQRLWLSLHGPESWDANPEVVCLSFRVIKQNIDALENAA